MSLSVTVIKNMNSYHILSKSLLLLILLLVDNCFSETTIQPTEKDGCPLFLVHGDIAQFPNTFICYPSFHSLKSLFLGGLRLKRAESSAHPTEWSICKKEKGEGESTSCLYRSISGLATSYKPMAVQV